jgi:hypothetical protein
VAGAVEMGLFDRNDGNHPEPAASNPRFGEPRVSTRSADDAFVRTPAATYPEAGAGIVLPTAAAVPGFTEAQVAADLDKVRQVLIAGRIDTRVLLQHDLTGLLALYAPDARAGVQKDFDDHHGLSYATRIAAGQKYSGKVRDKGTITFAAATGSEGGRELRITAKFVWVYAFDGPLRSAGDHLVNLLEDVTWIFYNGADFDADPLDMYPYDGRVFGYNIDCAQFGHDLVALGQPKTVTGGAAAGKDADAAAFDPASSIDSFTDTC